MEGLNEANKTIIEYFEKQKAEFLELEDLTSRVEVMTDNKLYAFYMSKKKALEERVSLFDKYVLKNQQVQEISTLFNETSDEKTREEFLIEYYNLLAETNDLFFELKNLFLDSKCDEIQSVDIEIISSDSYAREFLKSIFETFSKTNKCNKFEVSSSGDRVNVCFEGVGVYSKLGVFSGQYLIYHGNSELMAKVFVFAKRNNTMKFDMADLKFETLRSSGAGGQHINKTESAVRVVHLPTGITVKCQDERSQTQNKEKAIALIKEKILQKTAENNEKYSNNQRKKMQNIIFSGKTAFEIDISNDTVLCHSNKTVYDLQEIKKGKLGIISNDLMTN